MSGAVLIVLDFAITKTQEKVVFGRLESAGSSHHHEKSETIVALSPRGITVWAAVETDHGI